MILHYITRLERCDVLMAIKIKRATKKHSIYAVFDEWLDNCEERGLRAESITTYRDKGMEFLEYTGDVYVEDLTQEYVEDFSYYLKNKFNFNAASTNTFYRVVNVFLKFVNERYNVNKFHLNYLKEEKHIKQIYTDEDIKRLTKQPDINTTCYSELRTWLAVIIALNTGARAGSVCGLRKDDIDLKNRTILFRHAKNHKQFIMPVPRHVIEAVRFYLDAVDIEDYMFLTSDGKQLNSKQLGSSFRKYCKNRNVKTSSSFHVLRNWYASKLLLSTKNAHLVSKALGHAHMQTTEKYISSLGLDAYSDTLRDVDLLKGLKG